MEAKKGREGVSRDWKCRTHFITFLDAPLIDGKFSVDVEPV